MESDSVLKYGAVSAETIRAQQALRIRRFAMSVAIYLTIILTILLADRLGLGHIPALGWMVMIGLAVFGNGIFLLLFMTRMNLRLSDPSMTWLQIFFAGIWGAVPVFMLPLMRPSILMFYIPAFSFGMLRLTRKQYLALVVIVMGFYSTALLLHYMQNPDVYDVKSEAFIYVTFALVLTWFAFFGGFMSNLRNRLREQNGAVRKANQAIRLEMEERKQAQIEKDKLIVELKQALSKVKTLSGLLPICASCKKIRDDKGYWNQLESYIGSRSEAEFSHSICPDCARKLYPELSEYLPQTDR